MGEWAKTAGSPPQWTMETKLKMNEIYALLERRVEKYAQWVSVLFFPHRLMKMERVDNMLDFTTEFTNLTSALLALFKPGSLSIVDLQREFEMAAHDEELCSMVEDDDNGKDGENGKEEEDIAIITNVDIPSAEAEPSVQVVQSVQAVQKIQSPKRESPREMETESGKGKGTVIEDESLDSPKKSMRSAPQGNKSINNLKGIAVVWTRGVVNV